MLTLCGEGLRGVLVLTPSLIPSTIPRHSTVACLTLLGPYLVMCFMTFRLPLSGTCSVLGVTPSNHRSSAICSKVCSYPCGIGSIHWASMHMNRSRQACRANSVSFKDVASVCTSSLVSTCDGVGNQVDWNVWLKVDSSECRLSGYIHVSDH